MKTGTIPFYEYSPFGILIKSAGIYAQDNLFRFSSEYYDSETALMYYNYRYYDSRIGKWLNNDPIEENGGQNLSAFLYNNSISLIDHLGTKPCCNKQPYNSRTHCCCKDGKDTPGAVGATLIDREEIETGVVYYCRRTRIYYLPIYRPWSLAQTWVQHCWFHYDGNAFGAYPNSTDENGTKTGGIAREDPLGYPATESDNMTFEKKVKLSPCKYNISGFKSCVDAHMKEDPNWDWTLWNNCRDWIVDTISECAKKNKGCGK